LFKQPITKNYETSKEDKILNILHQKIWHTNKDNIYNMLWCKKNANFYCILTNDSFLTNYPLYRIQTNGLLIKRVQIENGLNFFS